MTSSGFKDFQDSRKVISLEEFCKKFHEAADWLLHEESPPEKIFVYENEFWIAETQPGWFFLYLERDEYNCSELEIQEMRLYLWLWEEGSNV